jgi:hypothetical protein
LRFLKPLLQETTMSNLPLLVSIAEDGPWCGTRPPGHPRPPHFHHENARFGQAFGPSPEPWRLGNVAVGLYGAIALQQMSRRVSGHAAEGFASAASILFDETCGTVPLSELIWLLLHQPPPPPPQWQNALTYAGETAAFARATDQEALANAAGRQAMALLNTFGLTTEQAR